MHSLDLLRWCESSNEEEQIAELKRLWALRDDREAELERIWSLPDTSQATAAEREHFPLAHRILDILLAL